MKKIILFILILLVSGCTIVRIDTSNINTIVDVILSKDNNLYNRVGKGYKYYVPSGVSYIDTDELNDKLYSNGNYYYLYVDTISYYKQIKIDYKENNKAYYSRKLTVEDGFKYDGYIEINQKKNKYYIEFVYNYAKIETVVNKEDINDAILNSAYILSTIQFNEDVIELMVDDDKINNREEKYDVFKNKKDTVDSGLQVYE